MFVAREIKRKLWSKFSEVFLGHPLSYFGIFILKIDKLSVFSLFFRLGSESNL